MQEAWLGMLQGLDRFEGRSSLKTWILAILVDKAKTRGVREARSVPFASLAPEGDEHAVEPERFRGPREGFPAIGARTRATGARRPRSRWRTARRCAVAMRAIAALPLAQQTVIRMRDVEGYSSDEVCATLDVSAANQRVLLHRARSRVRAALEEHLDG